MTNTIKDKKKQAIAVLSNQCKIKEENVKEIIRIIKSDAFYINKISQNIVKIQNVNEFIIADAYLNFLKDNDYPSTKDIDMVLTKLKFSMACERFSEAEWGIIIELYHEAIEGYDLKDIQEVCSDCVKGFYGKFMPKPSELAILVSEQRDARLNAISKLRYSLLKNEKFKNQKESA